MAASIDNKSLGRSVLIVVGLLVSASMLWLALRDADVSSIRQAFSSADAKWAAPFIVALFLFYWLKAMRWRNLLATQAQIRSKDLFPGIMIGYAGTAILPMQLGELVRAYIVGKKFALPFPLVLGSIGIERVFDLLTILVFLGLALGAGQAAPPVFIKAGYVVGGLVLVGLTFTIWLATHPDPLLDFFKRITQWMPSKITDGIVRTLESLSLGFQSIRRPSLVAKVAANSVFQWGLMGMCIWFSLIALGLEVPTSGVILVLVATIVGISLPTSPGYVGNIQLAFVIALQPFGVTASEAVAASLFYHALAYIAVVIVGFSFLSTQGIGLLELEKRARATSSDIRHEDDDI